MSPAPSIAVVITAYNAAAFIARAIGTVRAQTVEVDEIVVVDDGSTDETATIARRLGVRVVEVAHGGAGAARNAGIRAVRSDWVACLDVDDLWHPRKLEFCVETVAAEPDIGLVFSDFDAVSQSDGSLHKGSVVLCDAAFDALRLRRSTPLASVLDRPGLSGSLASRSIILPSAAMFRRELAERLGGFSTEVAAEDTDFFLRLASIANAAFVELPLVAYMQHPSQMTANWKLDGVRVALYEHVMRHRRDYHERTVAAFRKHYPTLLYYLAASQARNRRFAYAGRLLLKAVALAIVRRSFRSLVTTIGHGSLLAAIGARLPGLGRRLDAGRREAQRWPGSIEGVVIPWRIVGS